MQNTEKIYKSKKYSTGTALKDGRKKGIIAIKTIKTSPEVEIHNVMSINIVLKVKIRYIGSMKYRNLFLKCFLNINVSLRIEVRR